MNVQGNNLFITHIEPEGPFLKVWGHLDKNTSVYIQQILTSLTHQFDNGLAIPNVESLQSGILCVAKYKDNKYYRARILNLNYLHNRYIEVYFLDFGHKDLVPVSHIRSLEGFDPNFVSIPPQATSFLISEIVCPQGEWSNDNLDAICKEIQYKEVTFSIIAQVTNYHLVRLFMGVNDVALLLVTKGLAKPTSLSTQEAVLLANMPRPSSQQQQHQQQPMMQQNIATYKAFTLEPGSQYEVYVSYVTDGPCNFSVQLKQSEEVLAKLMKEINSMTLTPVEGIPIPGTVCLARCLEDGHICRAVVTNEVDGQFKVFFVDFGNFEVIPLESIFEIPFKFVIPKVMAIRFALSGVEKSTVTLEMQCAFKQFVDNRLMHMRVMPMTTRTALPRCELWDPENGISALDIVNQAASAGYPDHIPLNRGFSQSVKVSYVSSCNKFYVQLKAKQDELLRLMLDIQLLCRDGNILSNNKIRVNMPCYALYEGDNQWYRSQIVEILPDSKVKVKYVDYGNEEIVSFSLLKPIHGKQLTILRPQAIECCLNGYQNMEPDVERDNLLEELILEQEFTMKVIEMQGKKALIELIDPSNYNVASLLLDKIATTRSQVSPMLVQAGNKIEHRKSSHQFSPKDLPPKQDQRKSERNRNNYESTESNETNSWRQHNKGFNKNYDRNKRDDLNESGDSDKQSSKGYQRNDRNRNDFNSRNSDDSSWKQNNRGFNKNQGRFTRDTNRNDDWTNSTDDRKEPKEDWNNLNAQSPGWDNGVDNNSRQNTKDRDDWGGNRNDRSSFKPRDRGDWNENRDKQSFKSRDKDDWSGSKDRGQRFSKRNEDGENNKPHFNSRSNDDWGADSKQETDNWGGKEDRRPRDNFKKFGSRSNDDWGGDNKQEADNWGGKDDRRPRDNFKKPRERFNEKSDDWNNSESGYRKKPDFKREKSELSSSGSENSFRKGFNKSKPNFNKKFDRSPKSNFKDDSGGGGGGGVDSWKVSSNVSAEVPNPAPSTAKFNLLNVDNTESNVCISWFHNPAHFYCQLENSQDKFKQMMQDIQQAYKGRPASSAAVGTPIIGLFPEDNVLYRAEVLETTGSQFKVYYVDFGNVSVISKVWPIEMRFMEIPAQAVRCKLDKIEPPNDGWPSAGSYSQYFDKKQFVCKFLATEGDKVAVKLESNGEDIAGLLLRDGLAKTLAAPSPPELPLLIGQQFRAMLISVNSLADFSISLQTGVLINCAIFNLSESTETWEDNLKEKIEQILIVYVDDLKDDRLEVTLYDQSGQKIKLIDKDEAAYESVELLCPYFIQYSTLTGEVSHVEENTVYIQPSDIIDLIEYLLNTLYEYYENLTLENPITPVEGYVYAVKGTDANWYRGRVTAINENKVTVNYIDYGNSEEVECNTLRELIGEFMEIQIMCVPVTVKDATEDLIATTVTLALNFTESGLEGRVQTEEEPAEVPEEVQPSESTSTQVVDVQRSESIGTEVILSHTDSPSEFYLQLASSLDAIEQLQATLQEQIAEMPDMENPVIGVLCAAPYSLDQQWYRAQVLDADTDITTVRFVDYGNTDVLDNHTTRVKTLPPNLLALEVHATRCTLKVKPVDEEWTTAASERFEQLCSEALTAQFLNQDEKTNYVELYSNGLSIRDVLIQEKSALLDEIVTESSSVGFVSHLNSPSEFWIQLENCVEELEWVAEQLSGAESFSELEDLAPGTLCAALFPDDQMWYRARILSNTVAGIEVLFVDYGNSCTSCSLRELPEDLVMLQPLAQKCSLQKPEGLTNWGPEMARKFSEIAADGQTTFNVKKLSTGETASVVLLLDGVDVTTLLLPKTEEVRVRSIEGFDEIVLVKGEEELTTKYKLEPLPDVIWNEESVKKFEEISDDGKTVFQAEFISDDTVRLYLGLNDIRLDLSGVKTTTPTSSPLKIRSEKISTDIPSTNETNSGDDNSDIKDIIECVVEASCTHSDIKELVEGVVADVTSNNSDIHSNFLTHNSAYSATNNELSDVIASSTVTEITHIVDDIVVASSVDANIESFITKSTFDSSNKATDYTVDSVYYDALEQSTNNVTEDQTFSVDTTNELETTDESSIVHLIDDRELSSSTPVFANTSNEITCDKSSVENSEIDNTKQNVAHHIINDIVTQITNQSDQPRTNSSQECGEGFINSGNRVVVPIINDILKAVDNVDSSSTQLKDEIVKDCSDRTQATNGDVSIIEVPEKSIIEIKGDHDDVKDTSEVITDEVAHVTEILPEASTEEASHSTDAVSENIEITEKSNVDEHVQASEGSNKSPELELSDSTKSNNKTKPDEKVDHEK